MSEEEREPFDVTEESLAQILDVNTDADTPQDSSSPIESVELSQTETDAEKEIDKSKEESKEVENSEQPEETPTDEPEKPDEPETSDEPEKPEEEKLLVETDGKVYDFTNAPKEMRGVFKAHTSLVNAFVRDDLETVESELKKISPSSYDKFAQSVVQKSADAAPDKWAEYVVGKDKQMVANALLKSYEAAEGELKDVDMRVMVELYRLLTDESEEGKELADEMRYALEVRDETLKTKPKLSPEEQKELDELRKGRADEAKKTETEQTKQVYFDVFNYVDEQSVEPIVKKLGFLPEETDSDEVKREKMRVLHRLPQLFDDELRQNPETAEDYAKLLDKINQRDRSGAMALLPSILPEIEAITLSHLGFIKNQQTASLKQKHTPAKKPPVSIAPAQPPPSQPKPMTLQERLESASDDDILRLMGVGS